MKIYKKILIQKNYSNFKSKKIKAYKKKTIKQSVSLERFPYFSPSYPLRGSSIQQNLKILKQSGTFERIRIYNQSPQIEILKNQRRILENFTSNLPKDFLKDIKMPLQNVQQLLSSLPNENYAIRKLDKFDNNQVKYVIDDNNNNDTYDFNEFTNAVALSDAFQDIDKKEMVDFFSFLQKNDMMGMTHPTGRKIYETLKSVKKEIFHDIRLFRARSRKITERNLPFGEIEMFKPPYDIPSTGRFNSVGVGLLYTSEDKATAIKEIEIHDIDVVYDRIEWLLLEKVSFLDLTIFHNKNSLIQYCNFDKKSNSSFEYLVPRFVAQCAKNLGFEGIKHKSNHDNDVSNYVFFDFQEKWFEKINIDTDLK